MTTNPPPDEPVTSPQCEFCGSIQQFRDFPGFYTCGTLVLPDGRAQRSELCGRRAVSMKFKAAIEDRDRWRELAVELADACERCITNKTPQTIDERFDAIAAVRAALEEKS